MNRIKQLVVAVLVCYASASFANSVAQEFKKLKSEVVQEIKSIRSDVQSILISNAKGQYNTRELRRDALTRLYTLKTKNSDTTDKIQKMLDIIDEAFPDNKSPKNRENEHYLMDKQLKDISDLSTDISKLEEKIRMQSSKK